MSPYPPKTLESKGVIDGYRCTQEKYNEYCLSILTHLNTKPKPMKWYAILWNELLVKLGFRKPIPLIWLSSTGWKSIGKARKSDKKT